MTQSKQRVVPIGLADCSVVLVAKDYAAFVGPVTDTAFRIKLDAELRLLRQAYREQGKAIGALSRQLQEMSTEQALVEERILEKLMIQQAETETHIMQRLNKLSAELAAAVAAFHGAPKT